MKTKLFLLAGLLLSIGAMAQTKLVNEFPAMMQARNADPVGWLQANTTPDMSFIAGHDGSLHDKAWMMGLLKGQKSHQVEISDLKVQQSGDLAVATGISTLNVEMADGKKGTYKDAFTYTMRWLNGRWMITNIHHTKMEYK